MPVNPRPRPSTLASLALAACVLISAVLGVLAQASASTRLFQFFGRVCLVVYDLHSDHNYRVRDDLAEAIAPPLDEAARAKNKWKSVLPRANCTKPDEAGFAQQLRMDYI
jgi:hypothetical protein